MPESSVEYINVRASLVPDLCRGMINLVRWSGGLAMRRMLHDLKSPMKLRVSLMHTRLPGNRLLLGCRADWAYRGITNAEAGMHWWV